MTRPRLLDLFCGAGGAAMGYHRAGFDVVGVDIAPQPRYPFEFHQRDALAVLAILRDSQCCMEPGYDAVHASPPCQHFANVTSWRGARGDHADLLTPTLALLGALTLPWVVENVPEALTTWHYVLCGSQFGLTLDGRTIKRHRGFRRGNWAGYDLLPPCDHRRVRPFMHKDERAYADAMGCTWMTKTEAREAIPPAYTEYIGTQLLEHLRERAA
jgi:DNA (cytosine-5)-methyltransferase 1